MKYDIISPDGFPIGHDYYYSWKEIKEAYRLFQERYTLQNYYSSTNMGRIPLDELSYYCTLLFITDDDDTAHQVNMKEALDNDKTLEITINFFTDKTNQNETN